jgi:hypothetical protein
MRGEKLRTRILGRRQRSPQGNQLYERLIINGQGGAVETWKGEAFGSVSVLWRSPLREFLSGTSDFVFVVVNMIPSERFSGSHSRQCYRRRFRMKDMQELNEGLTKKDRLGNTTFQFKAQRSPSDMS